MMKRNILIAAALLLFTFVAEAAPITGRQAETKMKEFLYGTTGMKFSAGPIVMATPDNGIQPYYVFNISDNGGFVIISGDDAAYTVLGYSHTGHFDADNIPANMQQWLDGYASAISEIQKHNLPARPARAEALSGYAAIPQLMQSTWGQGFPYNNNCPKFGDSKPRPTGCAATAMAQVMYYHRWPSRPSKPIPAYKFRDDDGTTRDMEALNPIDFRWDKIKNSYSGYIPDDERQAIGSLMKYAGYSIQMEYGSLGSSAYPSALPTALTEYFGYSTSARIIQRQDYTTQEAWEKIIYNELAQGQPVLYSGVTKKREGHEFVCDGYDGSGLFHINWGWDGQSDGFFRLDVLDPKHQGTGGSDMGLAFTEYQTAVIGIKKNGEQTISAEISADDVTLQAGGRGFFNISLDNSANVFSGLQFDLSLPQGVTIPPNGNGMPQVSLYGNRTASDHKVNVTSLSGGRYRISMSSPSGAGIRGTSGPLLKVTILSDAATEAGSYSCSLSNVTLSDYNQHKKNISGCSFVVRVNPAQKPAEKERISAGDLNTEAGGSANFSIALSNTKTNYISMQFDLHLPSGIEIKSDNGGNPLVSLSRSRFGSSHKVRINKIAGGYRFVIYSADNTPIKGTSGDMLSITAEASPSMKAGSYSASIGSITACTSDMQTFGIEGCTFGISVAEASVPEAKEGLSVQDFSVSRKEEALFSISLDNHKSDYVSLQFDMQLPEGIEIAAGNNGMPDVSLVQNRLGSDYKVSVSKIGSSTYRFVIYSPSNTPMKRSEGSMLNITARASADAALGSHPAIISSVTACSSSLQERYLDDILFKIIVNEYTGIGSITAEGSKGAVYTISGVRVDESISSLPKGIYIIDGKKVVVR